MIIERSADETEPAGERAGQPLSTAGPARGRASSPGIGSSPGVAGAACELALVLGDQDDHQGRMHDEPPFAANL
jgi:hypothetical protein